MSEADALERLEAMRSELDRIDAELVDLLGRRFRTIRNVAEHKKATGIAVMQPGRVEEVFATRLRRARDAGLDPKLVERLWTTIITHACQVENVVGGIEGGELLFQGVSLDHVRVEVDDVDAACALIRRRLSFRRPDGPRGKHAALLRGGDVTLLVSRRDAAREANPAPSRIAIQVHRLDAAVGELRRRGNAVEMRPSSASGIQVATVSLGAPANLVVDYVERAPGAAPSASDFHGAALDGAALRGPAFHGPAPVYAARPPKQAGR